MGDSYRGNCLPLPGECTARRSGDFKLQMHRVLRRMVELTSSVFRKTRGLFRYRPSGNFVSRDIGRNLVSATPREFRLKRRLRVLQE